MNDASPPCVMPGHPCLCLSKRKSRVTRPSHVMTPGSDASFLGRVGIIPIAVETDSRPSSSWPGFVRANYRGRVPQRVVRTSWAMTKVEWQYVIVNGGWYNASIRQTIPLPTQTVAGNSAAANLWQSQGPTVEPSGLIRPLQMHAPGWLRLVVGLPAAVIVANRRR
jgi:hypothetical protein